jgi:hypothetical protein
MVAKRAPVLRAFDPRFRICSELRANVSISQAPQLLTFSQFSIPTTWRLRTRASDSAVAGSALNPRGSGVVVSAHASLSDLKPAPALPIASYQHVVSIKPADQLGQLWPIRRGARSLLLVDVAAAGGLQLGDLTCKVLIPTRDPRVSRPARIRNQCRPAASAADHAGARHYYPDAAKR